MEILLIRAMYHFIRAWYYRAAVRGMSRINPFHHDLPKVLARKAESEGVVYSWLRA